MIDTNVSTHAIELSFEYFPPRSELTANQLSPTAKSLATLDPAFWSVTHGAGGSARNATVETAQILLAASSVETVPHLAALGTPKSEVARLLEVYEGLGIRRIVALRGDLPADPTLSSMDSDAPMKHGSDLVRLIRKLGYDDLTLYVAAYPEAHPESLSMRDEMERFVEKVSEGANAAITQYFYNADAYARFLDQMEVYKIDVPVIAGIMPIYDFGQVSRFSERCGADIPRWLRAQITAYEDPDAQRDYAADIVANLCEQLLALGAPGFHFYTLNRAEPTMTVIARAGLR